MIVEFIDDNGDEFGVEPICRSLPVAPSTYYCAKSRLLSDRTIRDGVMMPILLMLWKANYSVYGSRKLWIAATKAGHEIGRDQVARLMRQLGIAGVNAAGGCAPRNATTPLSGHRTSSNGTSPRIDRTGCGSPI